MKWTRSELLKNNGQVNFDETFEIGDEIFAGNVRVNSVEDVQVRGRGYLDDESDRFYCHLQIEGTMLVPDAITNEEIAYSFETESDEVYVFGDTDEDGARIVTDEVIDLTDAIADDILLEVPLQVTALSEDEYPEGDGWKVYSEASYQESQKDRIDPRLAILKDFKQE